MTAEIIATGSTGNFCVLNDCIGLDCGVPYKLVEPYAKRLKIVLYSHGHGDHFKPSTARRLHFEHPLVRFAVGEFLVNDLLQAGVSPRNIDVVEADKVYDYGEFQISPVNLVHDVPNYGFRVFMGGEKAIYIVDTGTVEMIEAKGYDLYMCEANHKQAEIAERAAKKLSAGEFAYEIRAAQAHLSEEQAIDWLAKQAGPNSKFLLLHQHRDRSDKSE